MKNRSSHYSAWFWSYTSVSLVVRGVTDDPTVFRRISVSDDHTVVRKISVSDDHTVVRKISVTDEHIKADFRKMR